MQAHKFTSVDEYIAFHSKDIQVLLLQMRNVFKQAAPQAKEVISYNMPAIKMNKTIAYYAGCKKHIGFYPMPDAIKAFEKELIVYKVSKGTVKLPLNKPLNEDLITRILHFNIEQDEERARMKALKK